MNFSKLLLIFKWQHLVLGLLILLNVVVISVSDISDSRWIRLISTVLFFAYFLKFSSKLNVFILVVLVFMVLRDISIQYYEEPLGHMAFLIFGVLAYGILIIERLPKLKDIRISKMTLLISLILISANTYTLHILINMLEYHFGSAAHIIVFFTYGALMMIMTFTAVSYNYIYNSTRSLVFVFLAIGFLVSDITSLFAYYFEVDICYYLERISYLIGLSFTVHYGLSIRIQHVEREDRRIMDTAEINDTEVLYIDETTSGRAGEYSKEDEKASLYTFMKARKS